ncbi:mitochondrial ribonuclease P catalytic subunit isoform X2 [Brachionichthys hirsutus]|uniref:mitochondrial ribonuclease P catalytic subunit isoform X2 n=1 Tax=Brachionichthys hirsutus TaxID=412623 RepID=UPI003604858F
MSSRQALTAQEEEAEARPPRRAETLQPPDRPLSPAEWKELWESREDLEFLAFRMMKELCASGAELDVVKSLLSFVAMETGTLSYKLLLHYLNLCVKRGHHEEVFDVYEIMQKGFPTLEMSAATLFIRAFCQTARWREAIGILQDIKKVLIPKSASYHDIISAAMANGDVSTAWALYDEVFEKGLNPEGAWPALFQAVAETEAEKATEAESVSESEHNEKLLDVLLYMRSNQIYPKRRPAGNIKAWFESGLCGCCGSELESIHLTDEEYQQLKYRVMTDIIEGQDVFTKTTPKELEKFKRFVKEKPPFDIVLDGLNIGNTNAKITQPSKELLTVVSELERLGRTILVLGRKHMLHCSRNWDRHHIELIRQKAHCFFTENISEDDPFLLYATLNSGNRCQFVSRDLMRDHKACLPKEARQLFFKWQRGHQLVASQYRAGGVRFLNIPVFDTIVQTTASSWHIPYDDSDVRKDHEVPQRWLCLTKTH